MFSFFKRKFKKSEPEQKQPELEQETSLPEAFDSNKEEVASEVTANIPVVEASVAPQVQSEQVSVAETLDQAEKKGNTLAAFEFDDKPTEQVIADAIAPDTKTATAEWGNTEATAEIETAEPALEMSSAPVIEAVVEPELTQTLVSDLPPAEPVAPSLAPEPEVMIDVAATEAALEAPVLVIEPIVEEVVNEAVAIVEPAAAANEAKSTTQENTPEEPKGWARGITPPSPLAPAVKPVAEAEEEETSFFTQNWTRNIVTEEKDIVIKTPTPTAAPVQANPTANFEPGEAASSWTARLKQGLSKSRDKLGKSLAGVFGGAEIDDDLYEELETVLLTSDMGIEATEHLLEDVRQRVSLKGLKNPQELREALKDALVELIEPLQKPLEIPADAQPFVIMMAGVNGAGKTTSIGKLATHYQRQGKSVLLAAGDTFRAAAREQLIEWGARNNVTVISQATGDSAAVCFDAMHAAQARGTDIVLADTAGRLPTQLHLMEEIKKVKRVMQKSMDTAPHEVILVLDANIGQNAVNQVIAFDDALGLTGLILTKLDGTAKGGVIAALAKTRPIPIRFIGVGEGIEDLRPFNARDYAEALLGD